LGSISPCFQQPTDGSSPWRRKNCTGRMALNQVGAYLHRVKATPCRVPSGLVNVCVHEESTARPISTAGLGERGKRPYQDPRGGAQAAWHSPGRGQRALFQLVGMRLSAQGAIGMARQGPSSTLQQLVCSNAQTLSSRCQETDGEMESKGKHLISPNLSRSRQWFPSSDSSPEISWPTSPLTTSADPLGQELQ